ncbi:unnamed protein product [Adineta ricciae]|uniref:Uncharacterized protein n=1 Tax=Adineta ricciae TaxID=249248 RepID=A0A816GQE7_ADIRI|nr:unnamed protein product [Adineta ricciae]
MSWFTTGKIFEKNSIADTTSTTKSTTIAGSSTSSPGLTFDPNGNLYVADSANYRIQRFPPNSLNGTIVAGQFIRDYGAGKIHNGRCKYCANSTVDIVIAAYSNGVFTVNGESGVAFDSNNSLYVSNTYAHNVAKFSLL